MSLLMEALKRAPAGPAAAPAGRPGLALHLEAMNADLAAGLPPRPAPLAQEARDQSRAAFAARLPPQPGPRHLRFWIGTTGLILLLALGGYFWWQGPALDPAPPVSRPPPTAPLPARPQAPEQPAPANRPAPESREGDAQAIRPALNDQHRPLIHEASAAMPAAAPEPPTLRIQRGTPPLDPNLQNGHAALERGALPQARQDFEQVLQGDPHNLEALLSLAAIALKEGRPPVALQLYQAALTAHPKNARALAGYLGLSTSRDPEGTESRLKTLLQEQADAPSLYFALGNLLAGQGRWHEAQAAYFQASSLDGSNPDYRFNLAVSLDQLRQGKPAADHYRQALEAAQHRPAAFDPTQVRTRLQILAGSAAP